MNDSIRIQLMTLEKGGWLLRLEDDVTGLSLERKLDPEMPLVAQKKQTCVTL